MSLATNPSYPTIASTSGGGTPWSNITNVFSAGSGAQNVSYTKNNNHYSMVLQGTNIAWMDSHGNPFTFPNEATILGIQASFTGQKTGGTSALYGSYKLLGVPTIQRNDTYGLSPWDGGTLTTVTWGNSTDLWGASKITPAQLNSPSFGWGFFQTNTQAPGSGIDFTLFYGTIKVWYAINAGLDQGSVFNVWGIVLPTPPPTMVQAGGSNFNTGSAVVIGITNNPTPGNLLVALAFCAPENVGPVVGITGFTQQATYTNAGQDGTVWVGTRVVQAGDGNSYTVDFTGSAGGGDNGGILFELSGWVNISAAAGVASVAGQIASTPNMSPIGSTTFAVLVLPFGTTTATYTPSYFSVGASNRGSWMGYYTGTPTAVPVTETFTGGLVSPALYALAQITG